MAGYWVISDAHLMELLERAHEGESPGLLLAEEYANADREEAPGAEDR